MIMIVINVIAVMIVIIGFLDSSDQAGIHPSPSVLH